MVVKFIKKKRTPISGNGDTTPFTRWYKNNREAFNEQRRKRYETDPDYRQRMQEASRRVRQSKRTTRIRPIQYSVSLLQLATLLDVSVWTIRNWRKKGYFPEPYHDEDGVLWFTDNQVVQIKKLQNYFLRWDIKRLSKTEKMDVELISQEIHANWRS